MPFLIFIPFLVVFILLALFGHQAAAKRKEALSAWARQLSLSFSPEKRRDFDDRFPEFACLRHGSNRYAHNIASGLFEGRHVLAFDYHYTTTSTDSKGRRTTTHHHFSAVILRANIPLQPLVIRPENFFHSIGAFFGFDDIDFESAEFSRRFHVSAPNRRWAYDVLHARAMEYLLQQPRYTIEFDPQQVLIIQSGKRWDPVNFSEAIHTVDTLLDMLPGYVKQQALQSASY